MFLFFLPLRFYPSSGLSLVHVFCMLTAMLYNNHYYMVWQNQNNKCPSFRRFRQESASRCNATVTPQIRITKTKRRWTQIWRPLKPISKSRSSEGPRPKRSSGLGGIRSKITFSTPSFCWVSGEKKRSSELLSKKQCTMWLLFCKKSFSMGGKWCWTEKSAAGSSTKR